MTFSYAMCVNKQSAFIMLFDLKYCQDGCIELFHLKSYLVSLLTNKAVELLMLIPLLGIYFHAADSSLKWKKMYPSVLFTSFRMFFFSFNDANHSTVELHFVMKNEQLYSSEKRNLCWETFATIGSKCPFVVRTWKPFHFNKSSRDVIFLRRNFWQILGVAKHFWQKKV